MSNGCITRGIKYKQISKITFMIKYILYLLFIILVTQALPPVFAQPQNGKVQTGTISQAEKIRLERLAGLAKVWGTVKYIHPYLAYKQIDWDRALIETIPRVNAAKTSQDYKLAIDNLLSFLNDKNTYAHFSSEKTAVKNTYTPAKELLVTDKDVLIIKAYDFIKAQEQEGYSKLTAYKDQLIKTLPGARMVILDTRAEEDLDRSLLASSFGYFLKQVLPQMLDTTITLGSFRYRYHEGYTPQAERGSAGYFSAVMNSAPRMMPGLYKGPSAVIVILIDQYTHGSEFFSGLQGSGHAIIVQEGELNKEPGIAEYNIELPDNVVATVRTIESVNPDGSIGFKPDIQLPKNIDKDAAYDAVKKMVANKKLIHKERQPQNADLVSYVSQKELAYPEMEFPNTEYRLLSLFRFWNVMNYFFPYKDLIGKPWDEILPDYIRRFERNKNAADYQMTVRQLATEIHDSHVGVWPTAKLDESMPRYAPGVQLAYIENKTVVEKVLDSSLQLKIGDIIIAIDGEPVESRYDFFRTFYSTSTEATMRRWAAIDILKGPKDSKIRLTIEDLKGKRREIEVVRTSRNRYVPPKPRLDTVEVLKHGYGYIDLTRLLAPKVDQTFKALKDAPALILDQRGYGISNHLPKTVSRLTDKRGFIYALHYRPIFSALDAQYSWKANNAHYFEQPFLPDEEGNGKPEVYKGKVVVLIDDKAISAAEHTCLLLESAADVTFIGTPTMGANGAITATVLPGNIEVSFTGEGIRHADGRQLQRLGIQPHVRAAPTIKGLIEGRDEVLEAAINYLDKTLKK